MTDFIHKTIKIGKKDTFKIFTNAPFLATKSPKWPQNRQNGHKRQILATFFIILGNQKVWTKIAILWTKIEDL
jgi:hypothetical protein